MYTVKVGKFEGPLDLLLNLIEKEKLDITEISLAQVTDEFLSYIQNSQVSPQELVEFLAVACQLLWLKSKFLLPELFSEEEQEESSLVLKLKIYQAYREAGKKISKLNRENKFSLSRQNWPSDILQKLNFSLNITPSLLERELKRMLSVLASAKEKQAVHLRLKTISLKKKIGEILSLLSQKRFLVLNKVFEKKRKEEIIVLILAVLELSKRRMVSIEQKELFSPITVTKA